MPIAITCPRCAHAYRLGNAMAGKCVECAACGATISVPDPSVTSLNAGLPSSIPLDHLREVLARAATAEIFARPTAIRVYLGQQRKPTLWEKPLTYAVAGLLAVAALSIAALAVSHARKSPALALDPAPTAIAPLLSPTSIIAKHAGGNDAPPPVAGDFPELPAPTHPADSIDAYALAFPTGDPSFELMRVELLVPQHPRRPTPCIFVAPAGSPCITGKALTDADLPELLPYADAGFIVCGYSLDGNLPDGASNAQFAAAAEKFQRADAGLLNLRRALDFVTAREPQADPRFFFAAGHSSAGTLALTLAAREPRIKAVAAYCPVVDILAFNHSAISSLDMIHPGSASFARDVSPLSLAGHMTAAPIFLFGSYQDQVVDPRSFDPFVAAVQSAHGRIVTSTVNRGDHYRAMIDSGIPQGIAFFVQQLTQ
ncbi:MAG TPA: hypothetical protein VH253_07440 [Phycisphaerae bacterium]|nr:hypothetical protein [Phycisphaerae bacterium]